MPVTSPSRAVGGQETVTVIEAVELARALQASRWWVRPVGVVLLVPGISAVAARVYSWVSANRHRLPGGTPACSL